MKHRPKIIVNPYSLHFINSQGELRKIHCPFLARCRIPIKDLVFNETYLIAMVKKELNTIIIYIIDGKPYLHHHFEILEWI